MALTSSPPASAAGARERMTTVTERATTTREYDGRVPADVGDRLGLLLVERLALVVLARLRGVAEGDLAFALLVGLRRQHHQAR